MKKVLTTLLIGLTMAALPQINLAQVKKFDKVLDDAYIQKVYDQQKKNEKQLDEKWRQSLGLQQAGAGGNNENARDRQAADARTAIGAAQLEAEHTVVDLFNKRQRAKTPEERQAIGKEMAGKMTGVVQSNQTKQKIEDGIRPSTGTARPPQPAATPASGPEGAAPRGGPSRVPQLEVDRVGDVLKNNKAYQQAEAVNKAVQAANAVSDKDLERQTGPGLLPGTNAEKLLQGINRVYDGSQGQSNIPGPPPAEVVRLLNWAADLKARIADHNGRLPNPPNPITDQATYNYWKGVVDTYNDAAGRLNGELANLRAELNAMNH